MFATGLNRIKRIFPLSNKEEGFSLAIVIPIMIMLAVIGFGLASMVDTELLISDNFRSYTSALYTSESGIERTIAYFNRPSSFTDASGTYSGYGGSSQSFFAKRRLEGNMPSYFNNSGLSQFEDTDDNGVIDSPAHDFNNPVLTYNRDNGASQENFLDSIFPGATNQSYIHELMVYAPPPGIGAVATLRVTAYERDALRTVEQVIMPGPVIAFRTALSSGIGAAWQGNSMGVHWGEIAILGSPVVIKSPVDKNPKRTVDAFINTNSFPGNNLEDRWTRALSIFPYAGPAYSDPTYANPPMNLWEQSYNPYITPHTNLFCNLPMVTIDYWDYAEAKRIAQRYGTYYTTDAAGNIYLDGEGPPLNFKTVTNGRMCGIVFVDTIDRTPPAAGNLATIIFSGGYHTDGIFYIGANFGTNGLGTGGTKTVLTPPILRGSGTIMTWSNTLSLSSGTTAGMKAGDILLIGTLGGSSNIEEFTIRAVVDNTTLLVGASADRFGFAPGATPAIFNHLNEDFNITTTSDESLRMSVAGFNYNFSGALYCAGQVDMQGSPRYFGSIVAEKGYAGSGTPEVWYDWDLSKGDLTRYGIPNVVKGAWREIY